MDPLCLIPAMEVTNSGPNGVLAGPFLHCRKPRNKTLTLNLWNYCNNILSSVGTLYKFKLCSWAGTSKQSFVYVVCSLSTDNVLRCECVKSSVLLSLFLITWLTNAHINPCLHIYMEEQCSLRSAFQLFDVFLSS